MKKDKLIAFGFKEEFVSVEESGDKSYTYFTFDVNDKCVLISNASDECVDDNYVVEFFDLLEHRTTILDSDIETLVGILNRMR